MHPALHCWREELPATLVRLLAYVGGAAVLSILAAQLFQSPRGLSRRSAPPSAWVDIARPFPAFALSIPEAADVPASYAIRYNRLGGGRQDILSLGEPDSAAPYLRVEIYRPAARSPHFRRRPSRSPAPPPRSGPTDAARRRRRSTASSAPLAIVTLPRRQGTPRQCLGFVRAYDDPLLQLSGWFCRGGEFVARSTLACALDRLALLSAGSEPRVGALFAKVELNRSFCGQHDPILAATPKYKLLWKALATRPSRAASGVSRTCIRCPCRQS